MNCYEYYTIEVVFSNGQTSAYVEKASTSFEAVKQLFNTSKGAMREDIREIKID